MGFGRAFENFEGLCFEDPGAGGTIPGSRSVVGSTAMFRACLLHTSTTASWHWKLIFNSFMACSRLRQETMSAVEVTLPSEKIRPVLRKHFKRMAESVGS